MSVTHAAMTAALGYYMCLGAVNTSNLLVQERVFSGIVSVLEIVRLTVNSLPTAINVRFSVVAALRVPTLFSSEESGISRHGHRSSGLRSKLPRFASGVLVAIWLARKLACPLAKHQGDMLSFADLQQANSTFNMH